MVVLKQGSAGAIVRSESGVHHIVPAYETDRVFSIGSGDVYSAVFTYYWAEQRESAEIAADLASKATAWYCATTNFPRGVNWHNECPFDWKALPRPPKDNIASVYLAGPFFNIQQMWLVDELCLDFTRFTRRFSSSVLQLFKHHRTQLIEITVSTFAIIKHFDVFKYL